MIYVLAALFGYLIGSVPFGLVVTRAAGLGDVRNIGSGNIGATNVLRTGHKGLAALTLVLDALKGTAAALIAGRFGSDVAIIAGFCAFLGHLYPAWLGFKGGKGVATYLGVLLGLIWPAALIFAIVWIAVAVVTRYSSLAALAAVVAVPLALLAMGFQDFAVVLGVMSVLVIVKHRQNIARLRAGTEIADRRRRMTEEPAADAPRLSDRQRLSWLRLIRSENVGPASFRQLINRFGSAEAALEALPELVAAGGGTSPPHVATFAEAEAELAAAAAHGARFVAIGERDYPPMMRRMDNPPPLIAVKGNPAVFSLPPVAIVGARNASLAGIRLARQLASELGRDGYAVVSGLARGIDTAAHEGALSRRCRSGWSGDGGMK